MSPENATPWVIKREEKLAFDGQHWYQNETYFIQIFGEMVSSGLLADINGNALKILIALSLAASPLGIGSSDAQDFFESLLEHGIVRRTDQGRLFCHLKHEEICNRTGISKNSVTANCDKLVAAGLIERRTIQDGVINYNIYFIQPTAHIDKYNTYHSPNDSSTNSSNQDKGGRRPKSLLNLANKQCRPKNWDGTIAGDSKTGTNLRQPESITTTNVTHPFDPIFILTHFAARKGVRCYHPTANDQKWLKKLQQANCSQELVITAINFAFETRPENEPSIRQFAYCGPVALSLAEKINSEATTEVAIGPPHLPAVIVPAVNKTSTIEANPVVTSTATLPHHQAESAAEHPASTTEAKPVATVATVLIGSDVTQRPPSTLDLVCALYQQEIGAVTPFIESDLQELVTTFPEYTAWEHAFRQAVANNVRKLTYIQAVLQGEAKPQQTTVIKRGSANGKKSSSLTSPVRSNSKRTTQRTLPTWSNDEVAAAQERNRSIKPVDSTRVLGTDA